MRQSSTPFEDALGAVARSPQGLTYEVAYIFDYAGNQLHRQEGQADYVDLSEVPSSTVEGNVVVHNHPHPGSFSREDVRFLLTFRPAEMRVVDANYWYVLGRPEGEEWDEVEPLVDIIEQQLQEEGRAAYYRGDATADELNADFLHKIWAAVADIRGWSYRREERR